MTPAELQREKDRYLRANDLPSLDQQQASSVEALEAPELIEELKYMLEDPRVQDEQKQNAKELLEELEKERKQGVRERLAEEESKKAVPGELLIETYRRTHNSLFWSSHRCDDRVFWEGASVSVEFFQHFFRIMSNSNPRAFYPNGEMLIIAGIYDFTQPYPLWLDFLKLNGATPVNNHDHVGMRYDYQGFTVLLVLSPGGHLPHMLAVEKEPAELEETKKVATTLIDRAPLGGLGSSESFTPDPLVVDAYCAWIASVREKIEAAERNPSNLAPAL
jgi:DNA-binding transcriptional MerR regulator